MRRLNVALLDSVTAAESARGRYRLRFPLAGDGAQHYGNMILLLGFWH